MEGGAAQGNRSGTCEEMQPVFAVEFLLEIYPTP